MGPDKALSIILSSVGGWITGSADAASTIAASASVTVYIQRQFWEQVQRPQAAARAPNQMGGLSEDALLALFACKMIVLFGALLERCRSRTRVSDWLVFLVATYISLCMILLVHTPPAQVAFWLMQEVISSVGVGAGTVFAVLCSCSCARGVYLVGSFLVEAYHGFVHLRVAFAKADYATVCDLLVPWPLTVFVDVIYTSHAFFCAFCDLTRSCYVFANKVACTCYHIMTLPSYLIDLAAPQTLGRTLFWMGRKLLDFCTARVSFRTWIQVSAVIVILAPELRILGRAIVNLIPAFKAAQQDCDSAGSEYMSTSAKTMPDTHSSCGLPRRQRRPDGMAGAIPIWRGQHRLVRLRWRDRERLYLYYLPNQHRTITA